MDLHGPGFALAITAICMAAWLINNWIRARHGFSVSDDWGRNLTKTNLDDARKIELLTSDNDRLSGQIGRLEERIAVLQEAEELASVRPDLDGQQIMALLGIRPGPLVGRAYAHLLELRMENGPLSHEQAVAALNAWYAEQQA